VTWVDAPETLGANLL